MSALEYRSRVVRGAIIGVGLVLAVSSCSEDLKTGLAGAVRTPPLVVSSVSLPDVGNGGSPIKMQAPPDELYLVYFGYTSCPDVCPTTMSDISVALGDLPEDEASRVTVAMVTVDPDRDTDEILTGYLAHFFDRSIALRANDSEQLATAAGAFGVVFQIGDHMSGDPYLVAHTAVTYVVDDTGTVVDEWPFGFATDDMRWDLLKLLEKEST